MAHSDDRRRQLSSIVMSRYCYDCPTPGRDEVSEQEKESATLELAGLLPAGELIPFLLRWHSHTRIRFDFEEMRSGNSATRDVVRELGAEAVAPLLEYLEDESSREVYVAVALLGEIGPPAAAALDALRARASSEVEDVSLRRAARESIDRIEGRPRPPPPELPRGQIKPRPRRAPYLPPGDDPERRKLGP